MDRCTIVLLVMFLVIIVLCCIVLCIDIFGKKVRIKEDQGIAPGKQKIYI